MVQLQHDQIDVFLELMMVILCLVLDNYYWDEKWSESKQETTENPLYMDIYIQLDP